MQKIADRSVGKDQASLAFVNYILAIIGLFISAPIDGCLIPGATGVRRFVPKIVTDSLLDNLCGLNSRVRATAVLRLVAAGPGGPFPGVFG
ncbi:hypothetical protein [uncultured Lamprocystis sp.]|uniref:hypothetical protein n=1 Tax=uncultured Lamprocystis sp. TaxID=543132 RepID=UPI0025DCEAF3|nr:hypothetical protein [uncultured Lamprocystis sp.]